MIRFVHQLVRDFWKKLSPGRRFVRISTPDFLDGLKTTGSELRKATSFVRISTRTRRDQRGVISIVAIGIFSLLAIFGIIVLLTVGSTYSSIKNTNNYYAARDISDSVVEYLQAMLNEREAGFSTISDDQDAENPNIIVCDFRGELEENEQRNLNPLCEPLEALSEGRELLVEFQVKGRALEGVENLPTAACGRGDAINDSCYVVPFPGTGNAGDRCNLYDPFDDPDTNVQNAGLLDAGARGVDIDQIKYACNWNKLALGSTLTDRVALPLYYDSGDDDCGDGDCG